MTNTKRLRRQYEKLGDMERLKLALAAYARDDGDEIAALIRAAPRETYTMLAWPFAGMLEGIHKIAWITVTDIHCHGCSMFAGWGLCYAAETKYLGVGGDNGDDDDRARRWWAYMIRSARAVLTAWRGLELFCDDIGVSFEEVLTQGPTVDEARRVVDFANAIGKASDGYWRWLMTECLPELGADPETCDQAEAEHELNLSEQFELGARQYANTLARVWQMEME